MTARPAWRMSTSTPRGRPWRRSWRAVKRLDDHVSNFTRADLQRLLDGAEIRPALNQIECHPYHTRSELIDFCRQHDIRVMAHSPLSAPGLLADDTLRAIAEKHGVTTAHGNPAVEYPAGRCPDSLQRQPSSHPGQPRRVRVPARRGRHGRHQRAQPGQISADSPALTDPLLQF
ncbi:MAG: aldo/keto reductase [Gammaproteobacteria bacterium]|nr:aldo/keto reductase [Gammaproteobacteria bacterium]